MRRRVYIGCIGMLGLGGCSGIGGLGETPTATPTPTPTPEPPSFEVVSLSVPSEIDTDQQVTIRVAVRNTGGQAGEFEGEVHIVGPSGTESIPIRVQVPPGESKIWSSGTMEFSQAGDMTVRVVGFDRAKTVQINQATTRPEIEFVNLVSDWEEFGDAFDNQISSANEGDVISIAYRYQYYLHDSSYHVFHQVRVFDDRGTRVANRTQESEQLFEGTGYSDFEAETRFDTAGWETGEFTAEVQIRDEISNEASETVEGTFELR